MNKNIAKLPITRQELWERSLLKSIAHAIMTAHYPMLSYEQSWDGLNYNMNDSQGQEVV